MKAVWLVRSRELARRIRFWTAIVGYDPREHSLSQNLYLIYVMIFFSLWGFAMLALLANQGAKFLSLVPGLSPSEVSVIILLVVVMIVAIVNGYNCGKRSPFVFSETDAELICQTPVDRRQVALVWFIGDWIPGGLIFVALGVIFRFASLELLIKRQVVWTDLPRYFLVGMQMASIILPLYIAIMAFNYAIGVLRLRGDIDIPWIRWLPIGLGAIMIILGIYAKSILQVLLWPILFPLKAGYSEGNWVGGFALAIAFVVMGLLILYTASSRLNLSRAAQESRFRWAIRQTSWLGDTHLRHEMMIRKKLGAGHQASRIPGRIGAWSLIWKDWVESMRAINIGDIIGWLGIFGLCLGLLLAPDWGTRLWAFILGCLLIGQRCTERMRSDLSVWVTTRQLAIQSEALLLAEVASPVFFTTLLTWLAMLISRRLGYFPHISLILLAPILVLCLTLAAAFDVLRNCHSGELLVGQVPDPGAVGLILGVILSGIPLVISFWIMNLWNTLWMEWLIALFGLIVSVGLTYVLWKLGVAEYKNI
jgi:hypothetical protein